MEYRSNTQEIIARMREIQQAVVTGDFSDALVAGLNAAMGLMKRRIFNQSLAADGSSLGLYISKPYKRKRENAGRQVTRKDEEFNGSLRRSIEAVTVNNRRAEIRITNAENAKIAGYQEQQIANIRAGRPANEASGLRVPIFELSPSELEVAQSTTRALLLQKLNV